MAYQQSHYDKWVNLLVNNDSNNEKRYKELLERLDSTALAVMQLRQELFAQGRGNVSEEILTIAFLHNKESFKQELEELFLEYIDEETLNYVIHIMHRDHITPQELHRRHMKNIGYKVLRVLSY